MRKNRTGLGLLLCMSLLLCGCAHKGKAVGSIDDLEGAKIGVQLGTTGDTYAKDYEGDAAGTVVERYNKGNDAIQALKQNKIDAVIIDMEPAKTYISKNTELKILDEEFADEEYAICISKSAKNLKERINKALAELEEEGTLAAIKSNYVSDKEEDLGKSPYIKKDIARPNGTLIVATNAAFPPYEYYEGGQITGLDMDVCNAICDKLGMTLKIEDMEFDSIIAAVQSGKADIGAAGMTMTEDRLKNIDFTVAYTTTKQVVIVNTGEKAALASLPEKFRDSFIVDGRWGYLLKGLGNTLLITIFAILLGCLLGFLIAMIRTSYDKNGSCRFLNVLCKIYLAVFRGTPVMVQLLIIYYVIFASINTSKILVAVIAFGLNSAAYVAEVVRSGIMAVDNGQFEAGRSLGLNFRTTMLSIVIPQAYKNVLPALGNEFISLLKETSISGYIGLVDLTKGGDIIRSITYEAFLPLIVVALIYLVIVLGLSYAVGRMERRLKRNER